jgi:hypothetical protein
MWGARRLLGCDERFGGQPAMDARVNPCMKIKSKGCGG